VEAIALRPPVPGPGFGVVPTGERLGFAQCGPRLGSHTGVLPCLDSSRSTAPWRSDRGRVKCGWLRLMGAHYAQALHCYRPHQVIGLGLNDDLQRNC
jgi:hypothetical protein